MKKLWFLAISLLFGAAMVFSSTGYSLAAEGILSQGESCPMDFGNSMTQMPRISGYTGGGFIGALVVDRYNQELGKVVDVTVGPDGNVNFLLIYSCLPGMTDKLVAYPVRQYDTDQAVGTVWADITKEQFQAAPTIEGKLWPSGVGTSWVGESYHYFQKNF